MYSRRRRSARSTRNMWHQGVSNSKNPTRTQRKGMIIGQGPNYQSQYKGSISYQGLQKQAKYLVDNHFINYFNGPYQIKFTDIPATQLFYIEEGSLEATFSNEMFDYFMQQQTLPPLNDYQSFQYDVNYFETNVKLQNGLFVLKWFSNFTPSGWNFINVTYQLLTIRSFTHLVVPINDTTIQTQSVTTNTGGIPSSNPSTQTVSSEYQPVDSLFYGRIPIFTTTTSYPAALTLSNSTDITPVVSKLTFNFYLTLYPVSNSG